jgi:hypothetical protein
VGGRIHSRSFMQKPVWWGQSEVLATVFDH